MLFKHASTRSTLWDETMSSFSSSMTKSRKLCNEMNVTFASGDSEAESRPPTHSRITHILVMCWLTFDFSSFSRVNVEDSKNLMFFRSSVAKASLILAINTLKLNNKHR